jgi:hypothetical protein
VDNIYFFGLIPPSRLPSQRYRIDNKQVINYDRTKILARKLLRLITATGWNIGLETALTGIKAMIQDRQSGR